MMAIHLIEIEGKIFCRLCKDIHPEMVGWGQGCDSDERSCDEDDWDKIYHIPETTDG